MSPNARITFVSSMARASCSEAATTMKRCSAGVIAAAFRPASAAAARTVVSLAAYSWGDTTVVGYQPSP
jgi:hypothetical protein